MKKTIIITFVLLAFCFNSFAQEGDENVRVRTNGSIESRPNDEGQISGRLPRYNIYRKDFDFLEKLSRPELNLAFDTNIRLEIEKLENLVEILDSHWKEAIKFFYLSEIEKFSNPLSEARDKSAWDETNKENINKIRSVLIEAPNGKRNISQNEASGMITFLNAIAKNLIVEARDFKGTMTPLKIKKRAMPRGGGHDCENRGQVILRVTFGESATVTDVQILSSSGCRDFDKNSVRAAKKIKFIPAMINGNPITQTRRIMYSYKIY